MIKPRIKKCALAAALAAAGLAIWLARPAAAAERDHSAWDRVLKAVTFNGIVSYGDLKARPEAAGTPHWPPSAPAHG